jgi:hypothetical protein
MVQVAFDVLLVVVPGVLLTFVKLSACNGLVRKDAALARDACDAFDDDAVPEVGLEVEGEGEVQENMKTGLWLTLRYWEAVSPQEEDMLALALD